MPKIKIIKTTSLKGEAILNFYDRSKQGYKVKGIKFFKEQNGSFLFLHEDKEENKFIAVNGYDNMNALFYSVKGNTLYLAPSLKELLENPEIPKDIDEYQVAATLSVLPRDFTSTCYKHIKRLPHGHFLTFNESGLKVERYWSLNDFPEVRLKSDADYIEMFYNLYKKAVINRIADSSKTGIFLSSGLDSGTAAVLAAEELAEKSRELLSYTHVPLYDTEKTVSASRAGNERKLVEILCSQYPNIKPVFVDSKNVSPLDGMNKLLEMTCQPMHAAGNVFWIHDIFTRAADKGIDTMLTGQHGNMAVSFAGFKNHSKGLIDFINNYGYFKLHSDGNESRAIAKLLMPELILNIIRRFKNSSQKVNIENWQNFSAINPAFAEKLGIVDFQPFSKENLKDKNPLHIMFENSCRGIDADMTSRIKTEYGIKYLDPTYDKKLLEFCFGIPDSQYHRFGISRFLIKRTFNSKMPKEVLWSRRKGKQAADLSLRVKDEYKKVKYILKVLEKSPSASEILDLNKMKNVLERTKVEVNSKITDDTGCILLRGLMVGLFLLRNEGDKNKY